MTKNTTAKSRARNTIPPTAPPIIAAFFELELETGGGGVGEVSSIEAFANLNEMVLSLTNGG